MNKCHPHPKKEDREENGSSEQKKCNGSTKINQGFFYHLVEETDRFALFMELPGVKSEDLKVELTNGILRIQGQRKKGDANLKFTRKLQIDEDAMDASQMTATLSDGILEISAPKKQPTSPRTVAVVAGSAPAIDDKKFVTFDADVPGVKLETIQAQVSNDKLKIVGERKRGGQMMALERVFGFEPKALDADKLEIYLMDGVLTVRAPIKEASVGTINIPITNVASSTTDVVQAEQSKDETTDVAQKEDTEESSEQESEFEVVAPETVEDDDEWLPWCYFDCKWSRLRICEDKLR